MRCRRAGARLPRARRCWSACAAASSTRATPMPRPASRATPTPCEMRNAAATGARGAARAGGGGRDRNDRRAAGPRASVERGIADAGAQLRPTAARGLRHAIMTTDNGPKRCTVRAGGVTVSAQAKGAGMIQPRLRDHALLRPDRRRGGRPRGGAARAPSPGSFERITVDGQMSPPTTPWSCRRRGPPARPCRRACSRRCCSSSRWRSSPTARGRAAVGAHRRSRARATPARPSGWPARSPTRRWSRPRSTAATRTGDGSRRPPGWRWRARSCPSSGRARSTRARWAATRPRPRSALRLGRGSGSAHVYFSDLTPEYIRLNSEYTT